MKENFYGRNLKKRYNFRMFYKRKERKMLDAFGKGISILDVYTGMADGKEAERESSLSGIELYFSAMIM